MQELNKCELLKNDTENFSILICSRILYTGDLEETPLGYRPQEGKYDKYELSVFLTKDNTNYIDFSIKPLICERFYYYKEMIQFKKFILDAYISMNYTQIKLEEPTYV